MVVEVSGADITPVQAKAMEVDDTSLPEMGSKISNSEQVAEEPIVFGLVDSLQGVNGKTEEIGHVAAANFPKDAVDEWPAPKQVHTFYFARIRTYEKPELKAKIEQTDKDIQKKNQARFQIIEALRAKRSERSNVLSQLKPLKSEDKQYRMVIDEKRKEREPLHSALGKLRDANNAVKEKGIGLCSSEEELNKRIQGLNYRMQHESNTLVEEKQLLKEIKQLEGTRDKVIANEAMKAKIQDSQSQKEAIRDQVKLIGADMDGVRKDQQSIRTKIKPLEEEFKAITDEIMSLEEDLEVLTKRRDETYTTFNELRKARDEVNAVFYQNRSLLNNAKELAAKKDIAALKELSHNEVEKFMSQWSNDKAFRDDYERRILSSLDSRQLSRDGRMRNPDEKPIIEPRPSNNSETASVKISAKRADDAPAPPPARNDIVSMNKVPDEIVKPTEVKPRGKPGRTGDIEDTDEIGKSKELPKPNDMDAAKLKELKREEEIAKAKLAMERKRKLAEKAAAKAAARAQKEAEKRMKKEKEKQAKKKAGVLEPAPAMQTEANTKIAEPEEAEPKLEAPIPADAKDKKEKARYRGRPKLPAPLPKVILKRKKSHPYWSWAIPAAVVLAVVVMVAGYFYIARN